MLPGVTWALPGVTGCYRVLPGFLFWSIFFCGPKISAFLKLKLLGKNQFPPRDVTWAHACSRCLFTWPTLCHEGDFIRIHEGDFIRIHEGDVIRVIGKIEITK